MHSREYLTGFSKRKKERQTLVRNKAIEREREEKNEARRAVSNDFIGLSKAQAMPHGSV